MKGFYSLFISGYLMSSILLLPLIGLYFSLSLKKVSLRPILQFHKILTLLTFILPLFMVMISCGGHSEADLYKGEDSRFEQIQGESEALLPFGRAAGGSYVPEKTVSQLPALQDVVFYFADMILLSSFLGLLIFSFRYAFQKWRIRGITKESAVSTIDGNCTLIESLSIISPFSAGIFRKSIFIPKDISKSDKQVIIQHEMNHFRCHHHLWSLLEGVLSCVFWFNPMTHILRRRGAFLRELECDECTIEKIDRYEYTNLLVKTAESFTINRCDSRFSLLTQGWARKGALRKRIETLLRREHVKTKTAIVALIAAGVVVSAGIVLIHGNLNELTRETIFSEIDQIYSKRAPVTARVDIKSVPPHFINALLIHEDSEFFEHNGIRLKSIFRATGGNLKSFLSGGPLYKYGASTITQQLAKQFLGDWERTMKRKFAELKIARVLERNFAKEEILEMYLNIIYFGNDAVGLKAASETYFGHDYKRLTLSESTMLVPFIDAPSEYNMLKDPAAAGKRQKHLLERIEAAGKAG